MLGSGLAIGQTTGTVTGAVTDPQGGAVVVDGGFGSGLPPQS